MPEKLIEQTGVIGEKIEIGNFKILKAPFVGFTFTLVTKYLHWLVFQTNLKKSEEVAKNIAMQAAAMNPIALNENEVDATIIEKEIEIAKEQLRRRVNLRKC